MGARRFLLLACLLGAMPPLGGCVFDRAGRAVAVAGDAGDARSGERTAGGRSGRGAPARGTPPAPALNRRGGANRADVSDLSNPGMYPFVVNMSCLTGYFIYPKAGAWAASSWRSLAEGWMGPQEAGAVGALMPTGMTDASGQHILSNALYEGIFTLDKRRLGPAVAYARQQLLANGGAEYEQTGNTFMLFGDPATELKLPLPHRPVALTAELAGTGVEG